MKAKMTAIFAALIVGMIVAGASYAYWTQSLGISGTVATGELDAALSNESVTDNDPVDMDVGTCEIELSDDLYSATITIANGYPSYQCTADLNIDNTGTIPIRIASVTVTGVNETALEVLISDNPTSTILETGETVVFDVVTHVTEGADENSVYTFTVAIEVEQFNAPV